jgi:hypothetical protein
MTATSSSRRSLAKQQTNIKQCTKIWTPLFHWGRSRGNIQMTDWTAADSNIFTVSIGVVGTDEMASHCLGFNWEVLFWGLIRGSSPPIWGTLIPETVKCVRLAGLTVENDCASEGQQQLQTTELFSHQRERPTLWNPKITLIKIWTYAPHGCLTPKQTGRNTVDRNMILSK